MWKKPKYQIIELGCEITAYLFSESRNNKEKAASQLSSGPAHAMEHKRTIDTPVSPIERESEL